MELIDIALPAVVGVVGWLLANKDAKQQEEIKLLFKKHDADTEALRLLELKVAQNHYERPELDRKFDKLELAIKDGFSELGSDLREMTRALNKHLNDHPHNTHKKDS